MILYVVAIALLALQGLRPRMRGLNEDYLSKDSTDAVRGIFILLIFASHFALYVDPFTAFLDVLYRKVRVALGQAVVTCFLFYSGYGVALSVKRKGDGYTRAMPRKRILPTLLISDCAVILYLILQLWRGNTYSLKHLALACIGWVGVGNSCWYIFAILGLYLITWIVLRGRELDAVTVGRISVATLAFMLFILCAGQPSYCYDTLLCYPMGMWFFLYKDRIDAFLSKGSRYWPVALLTVAAFLLAHKMWERSLFFYVLTMLLFTLCVVLFTMKIQLRSPVLMYCGRHLQGLYLLHRIPFIILGDISPWRNGPEIYLYFALGVAGAFLLDAVFSRVMAFLRGSTPAKT